MLGAVPPEGGKAVTAGELRGDLYVKTSGDPTLSTQDLNGLAASLAAAGLRKVRGGLVIDTSAFDSTTLAPAFEQKDDSAAFRAPSSAASLNGNVVDRDHHARGGGGRARTGCARTGVRGRDPERKRDHRDQGSCRGSRSKPAMPAVDRLESQSLAAFFLVPNRAMFQRRVVAPETYFAQTFKQVLAKRGITIDKPVRIDSAPKDGMRVLATHESPTLAVVVHELGKRSSNFAAEQLLRTLGAETLGRPGTWQKGLDAVARYLEGAGIPRTTYVMKNGSGLYDSNRFSAEQIALVLRAAMRDFRIASEFLASLAVGGADGTLAHRMAGSASERYVRAKTGTLANVSCLSGIVGAPGNKPLIFSILMNEVPSPIAARSAQDRITAMLVAFLDPSLVK